MDGKKIGVRIVTAVYQGTVFRSGKSPVLNLQSPEGVSATTRRNQLRFLERLNHGAQANRYPENSELTARIANFETAARMQTAVPRLLDLSDETAATRDACMGSIIRRSKSTVLVASPRKLVEQGVRFVGVYMNGQPWDTHSKNAESLKGLCGRTDQPSAALVKDLKQRRLTGFNDRHLGREWDGFLFRKERMDETITAMLSPCGLRVRRFSARFHLWENGPVWL